MPKINFAKLVLKLQGLKEEGNVVRKTKQILVTRFFAGNNKIEMVGQTNIADCFREEVINLPYEKK